MDMQIISDGIIPELEHPWDANFNVETQNGPEYHIHFHNCSAVTSQMEVRTADDAWLFAGMCEYDQGKDEYRRLGFDPMDIPLFGYNNEDYQRATRLSRYLALQDAFYMDGEYIQETRMPQSVADAILAEYVRLALPELAPIPVQVGIPVELPKTAEV